jgi:hypothetical protein
MPAEYQGLASNQSNALSATITGVTNVANAVVTTSTNHDFQTGDYVVISGVGGATGVNNQTGLAWGPITVLSPTTFQINNSGSPGAYTSGGTAVDMSLTPPGENPSNGDSFQVTSVNNQLQTLADRTQLLALQLTSLYSMQFTYTGSDQTFVVPPDCTWMLAEMCGGGGGGEGGIEPVADGAGVQGGGGAGAPLVLAAFACTPGETLTIRIGAGGTGGALNGGAGSDGGTTYVKNTFQYKTQAPGGAGCGCGTPNDGSVFSLVYPTTTTPAYTDNIVVVAPGAVGVASSNARLFPYSLGSGGGVIGGLVSGEFYFPGGGPIFQQFPSRGGSCVGALEGVTAGIVLSTYGESASAYWSGGSGFSGGAPGTRGTTSSVNNGWPGGGGGGSGFGSGGTGGNGGTYSAAGTAGNGGTGGNGSTGAGGGGGGCGGNTSSGTRGAGGAGGNGGNGIVNLYWASNLGGA